MNRLRHKTQSGNAPGGYAPGGKTQNGGIPGVQKTSRRLLSGKTAGNIARKATSAALVLMMALSCFGFLSFVGVPKAEALDDKGLHLLLMGWNITGNDMLSNENLKANIFRPEAEDNLKGYYWFRPAGYTVTTAQSTKSIEELAYKSNIDLSIDITAATGVTTGIGKDKDYAWKVEAQTKFEQARTLDIQNSLETYFYTLRSERREGFNELALTNPHLLEVLREEVNPWVMEALMNVSDADLIERDIFKVYGTHFLASYSMGGWSEFTITTVQTKDAASMEEKYDDEEKLYVKGKAGIVEVVAEVDVEYKTAVAQKVATGRFNSKSNSIVVGGNKGVYGEGNYSDISAWTGSFSTEKGKNNCEIMIEQSSEYQKSNHLATIGIWELLPDEPQYKEQKRLLMNKYCELFEARELDFYKMFVSKAIQPMPKAVPVTAHASGSPSFDGKILINSAQDFANIGSVGKPLDGSYILTSDISLEYVNWADNGYALHGQTFTGTFDGNGHTIYGFNPDGKMRYIPGREHNYGLFSVNKGIIKNLVVSGAELRITPPVLVLPNTYEGTDPNGYYRNYFNVGLICGLNQGIIENCQALNSVVACVQHYDDLRWYSAVIECNVGGIAGVCNSLSEFGTNSRIVGCSFVSKAPFLQDPFEPVASSVYACVSDIVNPTVPTPRTRFIDVIAGGIVGKLSDHATVSDCFSDTKTAAFCNAEGHDKQEKNMELGVSAHTFAGGIAGASYGSWLANCFAVGENAQSSQLSMNKYASLSGSYDETNPFYQRKCYTVSGKIAGYSETAQLSTRPTCFYVPGTVPAVGKIIDSDPGIAIVPTYNSETVVTTLLGQPGSSWEYNPAWANPRLRAVDMPGFAVYYKKGAPDYRVGYVFSYDLSEEMTVYFSGYKDVTKYVDLRYDFSTEGKQQIQFSYRDMCNILYQGVLEVDVKPLPDPSIFEDCCEINGVAYQSFGAALAYVKSLPVGSAATITLLRNTDHYGGVELVDKKVTVDLNGKTLNIRNSHGESEDLIFLGSQKLVFGLYLRRSDFLLKDPYNGACNVSAICVDDESGIDAVYGVAACSLSRAQVTNVNVAAFNGPLFNSFDIPRVVGVTGSFYGFPWIGGTDDIGYDEIIVYGDINISGAPAVGAWSSVSSRITLNGRVTGAEVDVMAYWDRYNLDEDDGREFSATMPEYYEFVDYRSNYDLYNIIWAKPPYAFEVNGGSRYVNPVNAVNEIYASAPHDLAGKVYGSMKVLRDVVTPGNYGVNINGNPAADITLELDGNTFELKKTYSPQNTEAALILDAPRISIMPVRYGPPSAIRVSDSSSGKFNVTGLGGIAGVLVRNGGEATVTNATGSPAAESNSGSVTVYGDAIGTGSGYAVIASRSGGLATGGAGIIHVHGDVISSGAGAYASTGGKIIIGGKLIVPAGQDYIRVGGKIKTPADGVPSEDMPGYLVYTDYDPDGGSMQPLPGYVYVKDNSAPVLEKTAAPKASPEAGGVLDGTLVSLSTTEFGATIYYTLDGSAPTMSGTRYSAPIRITRSMTVRAIAFKGGKAPSDIMDFTYSIILPEKVSKPVASHMGGSVPEGQIISLMTSTVRAMVYYTLDGTEPSRDNGTAYTSPFPLEFNPITGEAVVKAVAVMIDEGLGVEDSDVASFYYVLENSQTVLVSGSRESGRPGDEVEVTVSIFNNKGIGGFTLNLDYDASKLSYLGAEKAGRLHGSSFSVYSGRPLPTAPYRARAFWFDLTPLTGDGELYTIRFLILENTPDGEIPLHLYLETGDAIVNTSNVAIPALCVDASVNVSGLVPGDINCDGKVNVQDAILLAQYIVGGYDVRLIGVAYAAADMNGDGVISTVDMVMLAQRIVMGSNFGLDQMGAGGVTVSGGMAPLAALMEIASLDASADGSTAAQSIAALAASGGSLIVGAPGAGLAPGDMFDVTVSIVGNDASIAGLTLDVIFDNTVFEFVSDSTAGSPFTPFNIMSNEGSAADGSYYRVRTLYSMNPLAGSVTGDGLLYKLTFRVRGDAEDGDYAFSLAYRSDQDVVTDTWQTVNPSVTGSSVKVGSGGAIMLGDVNGDGVINFADVLDAMNHYTGVKILEGNQLLAADVNRDGVVNFADVLDIMNHYTGVKLIGN